MSENRSLPDGRDDQKASSVMVIKKAALTSWFAAAWLLERKWPERWGRREVPPGDETGLDTLVVIG